VARGDAVVGVFCKPEKPGEKPDALHAAAQALGLPVFQFPNLSSTEAEQAMRALNADLGVMAYVLQFVPQSLVNIPKHGTIQYHPSLLPKYRGPSSINWPIARGDKVTGLSIFRPTDGLDEGKNPAQSARTTPWAMCTSRHCSPWG
jgi:methionyl-tRNA formyltransferase